MGSRKTDALWNVDDSGISKSILGLIQVYSDKTATSLKYRALVAYPIYVVWLNLNVKQRRCLADHGYTLLGFLSVGKGEMEIQERTLD